VRKVPTDDGAGGVPGRRDRFDVEVLAAVVVDGAEQDEGDVAAVTLQVLDDVRAAQPGLSGTRPQPHDRLVRVIAVQRGLAAYRVAVRREGGVLDEDLEPVRGRPVEADHHQVQVDGQRVHDDDLGRQRTHQPRGRLAQQLVVRDPRPGGLTMSFDAEPRPVVELLAEPGAQRLRLQAERVAGEVRGLAGTVRRHVEALAQRRQVVGRVQLPGALFLQAHAGTLPPR
jgi:hypothetical protein